MDLVGNDWNETVDEGDRDSQKEAFASTTDDDSNHDNK